MFNLEPAGTFGMYPICYQWVSGRYFQPEPAMYSRCFCWFPGPLAPSDNKEALFIFVRSTSRSHSAPRIIWAHKRSSKYRFGKTSFHQRWCAAVASSPALRTPWKVSWVIYNFSSAFPSKGNEERGYLERRWIMSPSRQWGILFVAESSNVPQKPTHGYQDRWPRTLPEGRSLDDWMLE